MTEAWSQVAAPAGGISGVLALWSDLAVAFSTCPIHSGVGSCKTTVREKQSWPFLGGKDYVPRLPRRSWAPCSFLCDVSRLGAELRCVSGDEEIKGSSMQEKKATLTQGTPFYSWKCVCVHVCVWGAHAPQKSTPFPLDLANLRIPETEMRGLLRSRLLLLCLFPPLMLLSCPGLLQPGNSSLIP